MSNFERMRRVIAEALHVDPETIRPETPMRELLGRSGEESLDLIELSLTLEEVTQHDAPDLPLEAWHERVLSSTVQELADLWWDGTP